ncbi:MAG: hypothetical protein ACK5V2_20805 [Pseudomonadota bacterium]
MCIVCCCGDATPRAQHPLVEFQQCGVVFRHWQHAELVVHAGELVRWNPLDAARPLLHQRRLQRCQVRHRLARAADLVEEGPQRARHHPAAQPVGIDSVRARMGTRAGGRAGGGIGDRIWQVRHGRTSPEMLSAARTAA